VNMESIRHTGATVLGLSVVDRQLVATKKASGEISKVTPLFLKPRSLNKEVNCTVPSPPVRIPGYGYKDIEAQRLLWFEDLSQPSNQHDVSYPSMEQHVFVSFSLIIEGTTEKVPKFKMPSQVNLQQKPWFHSTKMYFLSTTEK